MIDTDKYEGHTEGPWFWSSLNDEELIMFDVERAKPNIILRAKEDDADAQLIADAPLLLAEVKQLRTDIADLVICLDNSQDPSWFILKYNEMGQTMRKEGKTWYGQREEGEKE